MTELGSIGTKTGMILMIDPVQLFSHEEWHILERNVRAKSLGLQEELTPELLVEEILRALAAKLRNQEVEMSGAICHTLVETNAYTIQRVPNGILVQGA